MLGVALGAAYGLIALPMSLVWSATDILDLGMGGYAVVGGLVATSVVASVGGLTQGILVGLAAGAVCGLVMGLIFLGLQLRGEIDHITGVLASIGVLFAAGSFAQWFYGVDPAFVRVFNTMWSVGGIPVRPQSVLNLVIALALLGGLLWVLRKTPLGRSMRASAASPQDAALVGIPVRRIQFGVFILGGVLSALAGVLLVISTGLQFSSQLPLSVTAIGAVIVFGMRGPLSALAGGLTLGVVEALGQGYAPSTLAPIVPLLFIIFVLATGRFDFGQQGARP